MYHIIYLSTILVFIYVSYKYRKVAFYDDLTGVLRRGKFEKDLVKRMKFVKNNPEYCMHLYLIDLDNFKSINDTHGHNFGDTILKGVSKAIRKSTRRLSLSTIKYYGRRDA